MKYQVDQVEDDGSTVVAAIVDSQAAAERFAARRSLFRDCWGCVVRHVGAPTWLLVYKMGHLNDANVVPVAEGADLFANGT